MQGSCKYITEVQQQRPELPTVTLTRHACMSKVHKLYERYIFNIYEAPFLMGAHSALQLYTVTNNTSTTDAFSLAAVTGLSLTQTCTHTVCAHTLTHIRVHARIHTLATYTNNMFHHIKQTSPDTASLHHPEQCLFHQPTPTIITTTIFYYSN